MYSLIVKDQVERELSDNIDYYEGLKEGLGIKLLEDVSYIYTKERVCFYCYIDKHFRKNMYLFGKFIISKSMK